MPAAPHELAAQATMDEYERDFEDRIRYGSPRVPVWPKNFGVSDYANCWPSEYSGRRQALPPYGSRWIYGYYIPEKSGSVAAIGLGIRSAGP